GECAGIAVIQRGDGPQVFAAATGREIPLQVYVISDTAGRGSTENAVHTQGIVEGTPQRGLGMLPEVNAPGAVGRHDKSAPLPIGFVVQDPLCKGVRV